MKIIKVSTHDQIVRVSELAWEIQIEHFTPITGRPQIEHMLHKFQSPKAISEQIRDEHYTYYLLKEDGQAFGYIGFHPDGESLFLSKFYIRKDMRGQGYGKETLEFIVDYCKEEGLKSIWLTVNRMNDSTIDIYKKLGFYIECEEKRDLGDGFIADDYFMRKIIE